MVVKKYKLPPKNANHFRRQATDKPAQPSSEPSATHISQSLRRRLGDDDYDLRFLPTFAVAVLGGKEWK